MKPLLSLQNISVQFQKQTIISDINFDLKQGEINSLLGPSGCGKTTILRVIAGFEKPTDGQITLKDKIISQAQSMEAPEKRNIGMVFQDLALFPHLTIEKNIIFGLDKKQHQDNIERCNELLELINLPGINQKYPHQLSGGQQQRVALARAMAPRPDILLLDEPFSSLDVEIREQLAREVRQILKQENITALVVTHDQHEAFAMSDNIGLVNKGKLIQWDTPYNLYHQPATRFVADFIGQGKFIEGEYLGNNQIKTCIGVIEGNVAEQCEPGCKLDLLIRPDDVIHDDNSDIKLEVVERLFRGAEFLYTLKIENGGTLLCIAPSHHNHYLNEKIGIRFDVSHIVMFPQHEKTNE